MESHEKGGSLHTGGSLSAAGLKAKMEKKRGGPVGIEEVYERNHRRRTGKRLPKGVKGGWVDARSAKTMKIVTEKKAQRQQANVERGETSVLSPVEEQANWKDSVGGLNKGKLYGVGNQLCLRNSSSALSDEFCPEATETINQLQARVEKNEKETSQIKQYLWTFG